MTVNAALRSWKIRAEILVPVISVRGTKKRIWGNIMANEEHLKILK